MMHEPDHEEDEETEDLEVDEQMDTGVRMTPQRHDEEIGHYEKADVADDDEA